VKLLDGLNSGNCRIANMKKSITIKFLADVNVEKPIVDLLMRRGLDEKWIPDFDCRMEDADLIKLLNLEGRILITNDKDFGELTFLQKMDSHGIILIRVPGQQVHEKVRLMEKLLTGYRDKIVGHFIVIKKAKIRFIPMELKDERR
jgi:predicted nuclease of predicted toxin-antitoxin system